MNIFAKVVITTDKNITAILKDKLLVTKKDENENYDIFIKLESDQNLILLYLKQNFEIWINFVWENFEITKIINIWTSLNITSIDLLPWDVILPNAIINKNNNVVFIEEIAEKNYDLMNFWIALNGICLTLDEKIKDELELFSIREEYSADIIDYNVFKILEILKQKELSDKTLIIKIISEDEKYINNWVEVLEMFL